MKNTVALNRASLAALNAVSKDPTRYQFNGVRVTNKLSEGCNGHFLLRVTHPEVNFEDLPQGITPENPGEGIFHDMIIPGDVAKAMTKAIPKRINIPILEHAFIQSNTKKSWRTSDLDSTQGAEFRPIEAEWPPSDEVIPKEMATLKIGLNPDYLMAICKAAKEFHGKEMKPLVFEFTKDTESVKITTQQNSQGQEFLGVLMPMRLDK